MDRKVISYGSIFPGLMNELCKILFSVLPHLDCFRKLASSFKIIKGN